MANITVASSQALVAAQALALVQSVVEPAARVTFTITGSGGSIAAGSLVIVGHDAAGAVNGESIGSLAAGSFTSVNTYNGITSVTPTGATFTGYSANALYDGTGPFNCSCDDVTTNETLAELRRRMMVRLGYAAQADNPPPGMSDLLDDFLVQAQRSLYRKFNALRMKRFFKWTMQEGNRFYDLPDNDDTCDKVLDPYKIEWVGVRDVNGVWMELLQGIPPSFYTGARFNGLPERYEINQCIEVFPGPTPGYTLYIKGQFGLTALVDDEDKTSIDSEVVFLLALANAKAHYGHPDAGNVVAQANDYRNQLVSGAHGTARYVPGTVLTPPWTRPQFLPLLNP